MNIDVQNNALCVCYESMSRIRAWIMIIPNIDLQNIAMPICDMDDNYTLHKSTEWCNAYLWHDLHVQHSNLYSTYIHRIILLCFCYEFYVQDMNIDVQNNALCVCYESMSRIRAWIMIILNIDLQNIAMPICDMILMSSIVTYTKRRSTEWWLYPT